MADWKQIQARIRKAKGSSDPLAKLGELYAKTRDAMVAWERALLEEKTGVQEEAIRWFSIAHQRFRRAEWKAKAEEALARLGASAPVADAESGLPPVSHAEMPAEESSAHSLSTEESEPASAETPSPAPAAHEHAEAGPDGGPGKRRRRRGRRGGRGRRRKGAADSLSLPTQAFAGSPSPMPRPEPVSRTPYVPASREETEPVPPPLSLERPSHGRAGEPALASRLAHLEALLRRLISSPLHSIDDADEAPAGPGVFLLSDSDLLTTYYVENCKTLRVALGHLLRGGRGARGTHQDGSVRTRLSEHLGISDAKVTKYLKDHCVLRWMQLDEEAPNLAHLAIAVLRPPLNAE